MKFSIDVLDQFFPNNNVKILDLTFGPFLCFLCFVFFGEDEHNLIGRSHAPVLFHTYTRNMPPLPPNLFFFEVPQRTLNKRKK